MARNEGDLSMTTFIIDVKVTGFINVVVEAPSEPLAHEMVREKFNKEYLEGPISALRWKAVETLFVGSHG